MRQIANALVPFHPMPTCTVLYKPGDTAINRPRFSSRACVDCRLMSTTLLPSSLCYPKVIALDYHGTGPPTWRKSNSFMNLEYAVFDSVDSGMDTRSFIFTNHTGEVSDLCLSAHSHWSELHMDTPPSPSPLTAWRLQSTLRCPFCHPLQHRFYTTAVAPDSHNESNKALSIISQAKS